jgi:DNA-binding transcriptional ArsR family regulator
MEKEISQITTLIGDQVRTIILWTLLDGRAYTATELAISANTSPQNISMHLNKLLKAELLTVHSQGRHRYYSISKPEVAHVIEGIGSLLPKEIHKTIVTNKDNSAITFCRTCYDHLAGKIGVLVTDAILEQKIIELHKDCYVVTEKGRTFFSGIGIDTNELSKQRRIFARPCLDWSERRHHLAGSLGSAIMKRMLELHCVRQMKNSRALILTSEGQSFLYEKLRISV